MFYITVVFTYCGGPGSLLKLRGVAIDQSLFIDTQLGVGDSALWSTLLESQEQYYIVTQRMSILLHTAYETRLCKVIEK